MSVISQRVSSNAHAVTRWFECAACTFPVRLLEELNGVDEALDCGELGGSGVANCDGRVSLLQLNVTAGDDSQESNIRFQG
jgi:hypothetical protein